MKTHSKNLQLLVSMLLCLHVGASNQNSLHIEGNYFKPVVSPNLEYILLSGDPGEGLFLYSTSTQEFKKISDNEASTYGYSWDLNGQQFYYLEKPEDANMSESVVMTYSLAEGKASPSQLDIPCTYLPSFSGVDEQSADQLVVYTDLDDLQIYSINLITRENNNITLDPESQFYEAVLSHDQSKIAVHRDADIMIFTLDGSEKPYVIGQGIATQWSADDRYILGFMDESVDGHELSGSEIYLYDTQTREAHQMTDTEEKAEMYPVFYGKDQIIYSDPLNNQISTLSLKPQY